MRIVPNPHSNEFSKRHSEKLPTIREMWDHPAVFPERAKPVVLSSIKLPSIDYIFNNISRFYSGQETKMDRNLLEMIIISKDKLRDESSGKLTEWLEIQRKIKIGIKQSLTPTEWLELQKGIDEIRIKRLTQNDLLSVVGLYIISISEKLGNLHSEAQNINKLLESMKKESF